MRRMMRTTAGVLLLGAAVLGLTVAPAGATRRVDVFGGYVLKDSAEPDGPAFSYDAPPLNFLFADTEDGEVNVTLPFAFTFYDVARTAMTIGVNGAVVFPGSQQVSGNNIALDGGATSQDMIAPWWDDWELGSGQVEVGTFGTAPHRRFVVRWDSVEPNGGNLQVDFEMKLFETTNVIEFDYADTSTNNFIIDGASGTVGIGHGNVANLQYSFNSASLSGGMAIRFTPVTCDGLRPTQNIGAFAADTITGTNGDDVLIGLDGTDTINALAGNDHVCGGNGPDHIDLGTGNDRGFGNKGADGLFGRAGQDRLDGGPSSDTCNGGADPDTSFNCETRTAIP